MPAPKRSPAPNTKSRNPQAREPPFELNILLPDGDHIVLHEKIDEDLGVEELLLKVRRIAAKGTDAEKLCQKVWKFGKHCQVIPPPPPQKDGKKEEEAKGDAKEAKDKKDEKKEEKQEESAG